MSVLVKWKQKSRKFQVFTDGLIYSNYDTKEEADAVAKVLRRDEAIDEFIEDAWLDLRRDVAEAFGLSMEEAQQKIREVVV